jgi:hypothetical protein
MYERRIMPILAIHSLCLVVTKEDALLPLIDLYISPMALKYSNPKKKN